MIWKEGKESEPELVPAEAPPPIESAPVSSSKRTSKRKMKSSKRSKGKHYSDSEEDIKSSKGLKKPKSKGSSLRSSPRSGTATTKPNASAYGRPLETGGKCPKYLYGHKQEA